MAKDLWSAPKRLYVRSKTLKQQYNLLNRKYFRGKLPLDTWVGWQRVAESKRSKSLARCFGPAARERQQFMIVVDYRIAFSHKLVCLQLIHEMCHIVHHKERLSHGPKFKNELRRVLCAAIEYS